jgi:hypothetical protein
MRMRTFGIVVALAALAAPAGAATVYVANNGVDAPACGTKTSPCRSIGAGLSQANAGDVVEVGPGRYGDLDGTDSFGTVPGEEAYDAACKCLVKIDEAVTVRSRDGASSTLISGGNLDITSGDLAAGDTVVALQAPGSAFGQRNRGFTVFSAGVAGIRVSGAGASVAGNTVLVATTGIEASASGVEIADNRSTRNATGIAIFGENGVAVRNAVAGNTESGFRVEGPGTVLDGNAVVGNRFGVATDGTDITIRRSTIAGNALGGVSLVGSGHRIEQSSLYGNGDSDAMNPSCAVFSEGPAVATGNYWGSASGPGHDPADLVCSLDVEFVPFATKDKPLKLKPIR